MSDNTSDPARIERDLDRTRSRLGSHLSELQDRLSPGQVLDDAMKYFRGSEGADFGRNLLDSVRANPLPAALTGIGLAWLMASGPKAAAAGGAPGVGASGRVRVYGAAPDGRAGYEAMALRLHAAEQATREAEEDEHVYVTRRDDARGQAVGLERHAGEDAQSFGQRIRDAIASAQQAAAETMHDAQAWAGNAAGSLTSTAGSAARGAMQSLSGAAGRAGGGVVAGGQAAGDAGASLVAAVVGSPALLGALGLAAGALLGALLPVTEEESEALGGVAGQARETARSLAQQALDRGGSVAQAVVDTGLQSAGAHGLAGGKSAGELLNAAVSGELAGNAAQVARDVLDAGEQAARGQASGEKPA